jgi:FkbM family methyltransferase
MARKRGLLFRLIAVEGSRDHFEFMKTHLADNNIDPCEHRILYGVVSAKDGTAKFPKAPNPADDYGGFIGQGSDCDEVRAYSLVSLLAAEPVVDIIHCDIQGHEVEVIAPAMAFLRRRVRRIVVGTHGKEIEERLRAMFSKEGWRLDGDLTCSFKEENGQSTLVQDGAQLWVNPNVKEDQPLEQHQGRSWLRRIVQNWRSGH